MIRFAKDKDMLILREMWRSSFDDTEEGTRFVFSEINLPSNILVLADGGDYPVSMLCIRECTLTSPLLSYKAAYIYGVATKESERGKGYVTELLTAAHKLLDRRGCALSALVPREASLFGFYGDRGFTPAFKVNKSTVDAADVPDGNICELIPAGVDRYAQVRDSRFGDSRMFIRWGDEYLAYIAKESGLYGGGLYYMAVDKRQVCLTCYKDGDTVYIKELGAFKGAVDVAIRSVKKHFKPKQLVVYLREDVQNSYTNKTLPFGMVKWYDELARKEMSAAKGAPPYLAHAMD